MKKYIFLLILSISNLLAICQKREIHSYRMKTYVFNNSTRYYNQTDDVACNLIITIDNGSFRINNKNNFSFITDTYTKDFDDYFEYIRFNGKEMNGLKCMIVFTTEKQTKSFTISVMYSDFMFEYFIDF